MKKRIFSLAFAILICILSVSPAFASMISQGDFTPFEITVSAKMGTVVYDLSWSESLSQSVMRPLVLHIPTSTKLTVYDETEYNGELYLCIEYNGFFGYIKSSDAEISVQHVGEDAAYNTVAERSAVIIDKEGVFLRNGPSFAYGHASEKPVPYGTVISYSKVNSENESNARWAFTGYKGTYGWIYIYPYDTSGNLSCAFALDEADSYTGFIKTLTDGAFLTEEINPDSEKVIENIPAGTVLEFRYFFENYDCISAYVEYNGKKGWLRASNPSYKTATGVKSGVYVTSKDGLPLYKSPSDTSATPLATVPDETNLCVDYTYVFADEENKLGMWMHVIYEGKDGWIFSNDSSGYIMMEKAYDVTVEAEKGLSLFDKFGEGAQAVATVPKGTTLTCIYEKPIKTDDKTLYCTYVEYNGKFGWIIASNEDAPLVEGSVKQLDFPFGAPEISVSKPENAPEFDKPLNVTAVIIISSCVAVAVLIAVITAVTVKKKKRKSGNS